MQYCASVRPGQRSGAVAIRHRWAGSSLAWSGASRLAEAGEYPAPAPVRGPLTNAYKSLGFIFALYLDFLGRLRAAGLRSAGSPSAGRSSAGGTGAALGIPRLAPKSSSLSEVAFDRFESRFIC